METNLTNIILLIVALNQFMLTREFKKIDETLKEINKTKNVSCPYKMESELC